MGLLTELLTKKSDSGKDSGGKQSGDKDAKDREGGLLNKVLKRRSSGSGPSQKAAYKPASEDLGPSSGGGPSDNVKSYKHGGVVRKTGLARLHAGERVLNRRQAKRYRKTRSK